MVWPQFGIFAQGAAAHRFLEFRVDASLEAGVIVAAFARLRAPSVTSGGINLVLAFGADLWRRVVPAEAPDAMRSFGDVLGRDGRGVPAAQHDAWLWLSGATDDIVFEHARAAALALRPVATVVAEQACFAQRDSRDLTGFIDGTANPTVLEAADVAIVPAGGVGAGGSYVLAMRWAHDLVRFEALSVAEQERVIGRTKPDSIELDEADPPLTAHIARVDLGQRDGRDQPIYRRSVPYGSTSEHGLYFVAFSADITRFDRMLARMFGADAGGTYDRLTDFSRAVSGAYYFAPPLSLLAKLAEGPTPRDVGERDPPRKA